MSVSLNVPKDIHLSLTESLMLSVKQGILSVLETCNSCVHADLPVGACHLCLALVFLQANSGSCLVNMLTLYIYGKCWHIFAYSYMDRCVWMPVSMLLYWYAWANITWVSGFMLDVVALAQRIRRVVDCSPGHAGIQRECRSVVAGSMHCFVSRVVSLLLLLPGGLRAWCHFHNLFSNPYNTSWKHVSVHDPLLLSPCW